MRWRAGGLNRIGMHIAESVRNDAVGALVLVSGVVFSALTEGPTHDSSHHCYTCLDDATDRASPGPPCYFVVPR